MQKDTEDPSDSREPSSEERERLLAVDEEPSDEDGGGGGEIDNSSSQQSNLKPFERKLLLLSSKGAPSVFSSFFVIFLSRENESTAVDFQWALGINLEC